MKRLLAVCLLIVSIDGSAVAGSYNRKGQSGQTIMLGRYHTWNPDCTGALGTVKLLTRPQHGKLTKRLVTVPIGASKVVGIDGCYGRPIKSLEVSYTPNTGYRGADTITFDVTYRRLHEVDTFTVDVQ